jgi:CHAT domain-containing protein
VLQFQRLVEDREIAGRGEVAPPDRGGDGLVGANDPAGDDLVSLSGAFLAAGAASVLASLWEVDDLAATALMRRFYRHLATEPDRALALARTQRELLAAGGRIGSPRNWASFVLVGAAR